MLLRVVAFRAGDLLAVVLLAVLLRVVAFRAGDLLAVVLLAVLLRVVAFRAGDLLAVLLRVVAFRAGDLLVVLLRVVDLRAVLLVDLPDERVLRAVLLGALDLLVRLLFLVTGILFLPVSIKGGPS